MRKSTIKRAIAAVAVIVLIISGILLASRLEHMSEKAPEGAGTSSVTVSNGLTITVGDSVYRLNQDLSTLLLIGVDDMEVEQHEGYRYQGLADYLALIILNNREKTCTILQIDRNTMAEIPVLGEGGIPVGNTIMQICYAHAFGEELELSCENTVNTVSHLLCGVPIDNYLSMTMGAIPILNDAVGGVTVTIEDDFTGVDDTLIRGQTVHLMGEHAFNFVHERFRMIDDANTSRMRRQADYMTGLVEVLREKTKADSNFAMELYNTLADYLVMDCDVNTLSSLSENLAEYTLTGFVSPEGENIKTDLIEFYPDEEKLQQLVIDLFCLPVEG